MSVRRQLYEQLAKVPGGNPALRITALAAHLETLPPDTAAATERRLLALAIAMTPGEGVEITPRMTVDQFFEKVDEIERGLVN